MTERLALPITEPSQLGQARRLATALAERLGFDEAGAGRVAIVVTEVATNLLKHGKGGELLVSPVSAGGVNGIEILALDKGPGIANLAQALRDGYSTAGSPGTGLGAIVRLAALFDIHTAAGVGTAVLARLWPGVPAGTAVASRLEVAAVSVPKPGEEVCGDGWGVEQQAGRHLIAVADGLGHGVQAAEASREAIRIFRVSKGLPLRALIETVHAALRSTRGAAMAVAEVDIGRQVLRYCGVGNIAGAVLSDTGSRHLVSHNGTLGHEIRRIDEFTYPWPNDALLVLHSDGLASHWDLERYAGLAGRHPSLIAGVLYRDFNRGRDDVTVVVGQASGG